MCPNWKYLGVRGKKECPCCKQPPLLIVCCPFRSSSRSLSERERLTARLQPHMALHGRRQGASQSRPPSLRCVRCCCYNVGWHNQVSGTASALSLSKITLSAMLAQPPHHNNTETSPLHQQCSDCCCEVNVKKRETRQGWFTLQNMGNTQFDVILVNTREKRKALAILLSEFVQNINYFNVT